MDFFEHSLQLMMAVFSWACIGHGSEIFSPMEIENGSLAMTYLFN
jgi:hypothetical protein